MPQATKTSVAYANSTAVGLCVSANHAPRTKSQHQLLHLDIVNYNPSNPTFYTRDITKNPDFPNFRRGMYPDHTHPLNGGLPGGAGASATPR